MVLNSVAVRPTYVSFSSSVVTVAWYTISFCRHSPCNGQSFLFLQLLVFRFGSCTGGLSFVKIALLCPSINCFMLCAQL